MTDTETQDPAGPADAASLGSRELRGTTVGNSYSVKVVADHFGWTLDETVAKGGSDTGPTPVQSFLGALLSCFTISFQFAARRKEVPIDRIEGWIAANEQKFITEIALELQVWSAAPEAAVRELLPRAERGCFVRNVIKEDIDLTIDLIISGPYVG